MKLRECKALDVLLPGCKMPEAKKKKTKKILQVNGKDVH